MRMIDADAFERDLTEHILPILIQRYGEEEAIRGLHFSYSDCISNISGQPTIEERKKGKWIEFQNHYAYKCSECGRIIETVDGKSNVCKHYPYCHCGAKMEG